MADDITQAKRDRAWNAAIEDYLTTGTVADIDAMTRRCLIDIGDPQRMTDACWIQLTVAYPQSIT